MDTKRKITRKSAIKATIGKIVEVQVDLFNVKSQLQDIEDTANQIGDNCQEIINLCDKFKLE